jgi:glutamate/tyrosine decarboxylase-like PLP-dependent enzyme
MEKLLTETANRATRYLASLPERSVVPSPVSVAALEKLGGPLPESPADPAQVLALLDDIGSPATVATAGPRYFGFVIGGTLPAALAANWLAGAWDQNGAMQISSPVAARLEEIVLQWTIDLLDLPAGSGAGFVTGTTMANFTSLAAARAALLKRAGWNVEEDGLFGAPPIDVVVGDEVHVSLLKALSLLGFGRSRVTRIPVDNQGRMRFDALPPLNDRTLLCIQAGNVNTGAFDPAEQICARARDANAWVHVDGAFGLWGALSPQYAPLLAGFNAADSWAIDCHKWLNVPYDSGLAVVREPKHLQAAMSISAAYLTSSNMREPWHYVPESSRRARAQQCAPSVAPDSVNSSSAIAVRRASSHNSSQTPDFPSSMMLSSTRSLCPLELPIRLARSSRPFKAKAPAGVAEPSGKATPPCASASQAGRRLMRMFNAAPMPSSKSPASF